MSQARVGTFPRRRMRSRRAGAAWRRALRRRRRQFFAAWRHWDWRARAALCALLVVAIWVPVNFAYQILAKPSELLAPLSDLMMKTPAETWSDYAPLFRRSATATISPELLAALAQVESAGNPLATTYWRWQFSLNPLAIYRPASSSVGLYQMTDGAFAEARHYCIRDHRVAEDSADATPCGGSGIHMRIMPSDATELAAAYLDRKVTALTAKRKPATSQQRDNLAAMIHLCGAGPAEDYVRRDFRLAPGQRCGDQDVAAYIGRVGAFEREFTRLAQADAP